MDFEAVLVELRGQILELTDATSKIASLMQKNNPKLKALANQSLATQKAQLAVVAGKIHDAQEIQENARVTGDA